MIELRHRTLVSLDSMTCFCKLSGLVSCHGLHIFVWEVWNIE